eukprot:4190695-Pleurochrysis_carterae.AAC.1
MKCKWGHPVATLPSDEGDHTSLVVGPKFCEPVCREYISSDSSNFKTATNGYISLNLYNLGAIPAARACNFMLKRIPSQRLNRI